MVLDKEDHRSILLTMINQATIPGTHVEIVAEIKQALSGAVVSGSEGDQGTKRERPLPAVVG